MKPRLFLDTNVILDLLTDRHPFYQSAAELFSLADNDKIVLVVSALSFSTANYFIAKFENSLVAKEKIKKFRVLCEIWDLSALTIDKGLNSEFKDFEDALQYFSAKDAGCDFLITRNGKDFKSANIPILTVDEYLEIYRR
ncbi:MAG TPA: PIN domain-containing protein [Pelobium sp.]